MTGLPDLNRAEASNRRDERWTRYEWSLLAGHRLHSFHDGAIPVPQLGDETLRLGRGSRPAGDIDQRTNLRRGAEQIVDEIPVRIEHRFSDRLVYV